MVTGYCIITLYPFVRSVSPLSPLNGAPLSNPHFILVLPRAEVFEPASVHYLSFDVLSTGIGTRGLGLSA